MVAPKKVVKKAAAPKTAAAPKKRVAAKTAIPKSTAAKKTTSHRSAATKRGRVSRPISDRERYEMIQTMAYYRAEQRHFVPGHEYEDWLEAEQMVDQMLAQQQG